MEHHLHMFERRFDRLGEAILWERLQAHHPTFLGLPPFFPFSREASALALDVACPARAAIHRAVPNTPFIRPGTV
jgi:hypothetical protein